MNVDFLIDVAVISLIIVISIVLCVLFLRGSEKEEDIHEMYTYPALRRYVKERVDELVGTNMMGMGLSKQELYNQEQHQQTISSCIRLCCSGDPGAREALKELVRTILLTDLGIDEELLHISIPYDNKKGMSARQMFETMLYKLDNGKQEGLAELCKKYNWWYPTAENGYSITESMIRNAYEELRLQLNFADKLNVLTQLIYADDFGHQIIDSLNEQVHSVEEIQLGLCGLPERAYHYKDELIGALAAETVEYSKDSINIVLKGNCIKLPFLSFETDDELERAIRNLIKGSGAGELTASTPEIVINTIDDRRVSVAMPPIADSYVGFVRKFDAILDADLAYWCSGMKDSEEVVQFITWLMKAKLSTAVNGDMGVGKTTAIRGALAKSPEELAIRVIESESFEINARRYLNGRNTMALRVTDATPEDQVLAFVRKTSGQVFCVGEITSPRMAKLSLDLMNFAQQVIFSSHYVSTDGMISAFVGALLGIGGYSSEKLAEMEVVRSIRYDIHLEKKDGIRYVHYINEIVPVFDTESWCDVEDITRDNASQKVAVGLREVRKQLGQVKTYMTRTIMRYDIETEKLEFLNRPSEETFKRAKNVLSAENCLEFKQFIDRLFPEGQGD